MGVLALAGCGRIGFAVLPDAAPPDACTWSAFSTPAKLPGPVQSTSGDWSPTPTLGELEVYFFSYRGATADLYYATRATVDADFGAASPVSELNTNMGELGVTLTEDALMIVFERATTLGDLLVATRSTPTDPFGPAMPIAELDTALNTENEPSLSADGTRIVFSSARGTTMLDIYEATRASRELPFDPPVALTELNSAYDDGTPSLSADGLDIYFSSSRAGGRGGVDVYTSHRPALDQPFAQAQLVLELSSPLDDAWPKLSPDGKTMYIVYGAVAATGANADLMTATRTCN